MTKSFEKRVRALERAREKEAEPGSETWLRDYMQSFEEARMQRLAAGDAGPPPETPITAETPEDPGVR